MGHKHYLWYIHFPSISPDAKTLLHNAEQAIYYGKLGGKGHLTVYRTGLETRSTDSNLRTAYERVAPTIYALTAAIDAKDSYTFIHSMNVSKYAVILARDLGMSENDIELVRDAGMLHDIGKSVFRNAFTENLAADTGRI